MDAQDTRTAQERIDQAEGRLAALQEQGIDTAGLNSQLAFARAALAQGQTLDVMAMCEEVLIAAKRLVAQPPLAANRPVKTDRIQKPQERVPSGLYPSLGGPDEARDRQRLTEEIRQAVHSDLMPKALSATQLNDRIRTTVERTLDERLKLLQDSLSSKLDERFQRLAAEPITAAFAKPPSVEEVAAHVEEHLAKSVDQRLEIRATALAHELTQQSAHAIAEATGGIEARLNELTNPERLRAGIVSAVEEACARAELARTAAATHQYATTEAALAKLNASMTAWDSALPTTVTGMVNAALPDAVQAAVQAAMHVALSTVTEAVMTPVRELVAEALTQSKSAPPDLDALATRLGNDLRSDLDWQVERLAAEKGWVTLADVHAEMRTSPNNKPGADNPTAPGFARLEAALVEFVRQTQSQQQQFLNVLQERVEQGTAVVAQNLAKAIAADKNRSSTVFRQPPKSGDGDTATINRATDSRMSDEQSALESHTSNAQERELDALSMTAQYRAIDTLGDPQRQTPMLNMLPGTRVTGRIPIAPLTASVQAAEPSPVQITKLVDDHSSATRPSTMIISNRTALDLTQQDDTAGVDPSAMTTENFVIADNLGTEAIEMTPLQESAGEGSGLVARSETQRHEPALPSADMIAMATPETHESNIPGTSTDAITRVLTHTVSLPVKNASAQPATTRQPKPPASTGKTTNPTSRVAAFETGLRNLVKGEVERQLGSEAIASPSPSANSSATGALTRETTTSDLDRRIRVAIQKALAELPGVPTSGSEVRLTVPCDMDLRAAITRSMPDMMKDPAIRQQILGVVAVEAMANPGALGELTGIRAFIRAEVRHAHGEAMHQAQGNDAATTVPPAALETPPALIS